MALTEDLPKRKLRRGRRYGFEMKASEVPRLTPSMRIELEGLKLERLWVLHPGNAPACQLHERVVACSLPQWMRERAGFLASKMGT